MIPNEVQTLRAFINEGREKLLNVPPASTPDGDWLREYSQLLDETLRRIYRAAWDAARRAHDYSNGPNENSLALLAIGGYGRGDLCPHSDIDIAFIPVEEENPLIDAVIKEAFRLIVEVLIDGVKLDVGYAYRPLSDIEHLDTTGKTALVEARLLAGPEVLLSRAQNELHRKWDAVAFLLDIAHERREIARHIPLALYAVEPNIKEGAGALRDIHTVVWVTDAMLQAQPALQELEWRGLITGEEVAQLENARAFFLRLRLWLHLSSEKKTDVLRVDLQHQCALDFGYKGEGAIASQQLLREYYRHGERVSRVLEKLLRQLLAGPLALDGHFSATGQKLHSAHPHVLANHPELIVTPFVLARKYGFLFAPELDRAIENALPLVDETTRRNSIIRASFRALLRQSEETASVLISLRARGVLQVLIPEFEDILHLAPGDPSHQLTVGEHSLHTVRELLESWKTRGEREEIFNIWAGCDDMEVLVLGTLLHDVGKSQIGTDHSQSGAQIAREIALRLGFSPERSERVAFLVRQHLLLPRVSRLRDLSSPATILQVLEIVPDVNTLKMLYLLSVADTRAVGERTYSPLDLQVMRELYDKVLLAMTRAETAEALTDAEKREQLAERERAALRRAVRRSDVALDENSLHRLCEDLPASYVLNTPLATIVTHLQLLDQLPQEGLLVDYNDDERGLSTEVTIVTCDDEQPGLLSKVCGVMYALGVEILAAQVHTLRGMAPENFDGGDETSAAPFLVRARRGDIVLDRLQVEMSGRALSETKRARLSAALRAVLCEGKNVEELLREAGKNTTQPLSVQRVLARNDLSDEHTVITIISDNVPGLMYFLTGGLAAVGLDIHTAKITGWSGRAEDAFYVTSRPQRDNGDSRAGKIRDDAIPGVLQALTETLERNEDSV